MVILKNVQPASTHRCDTPDPTQYGIGTVWGCDTCGRQARLENDQRDGLIWMWLSPSNYLPSRRHVDQGLRDSGR